MASDKPRRLRSRIAVGTVVTVVIAAAGVAVTYGQLHLADVENQATEQQSLVALVTDIAHVSQEADTATDNAALDAQGAADADQALALVQELHNRVPMIDNLEIAGAFETITDYHNALESFARASTSASDPFDRAKALRAAAALNYYIGGRRNQLAAEAETAEAYHAFDGQPDVPAVDLYQDRELADVWDAEFSARAGCGRASDEVAGARHMIAEHPYSNDDAVNFYLGQAQTAVRDCTRGRPVPYLPPYVGAS